MDAAEYHLGFESLDLETSAQTLDVEGAFPDWLNGILCRTGPARFEIGKQLLNHWFDGQAMLHAFQFDGGRVRYSNRFLRSRSFEAAQQQNRLTRREFATDPCYSLFGKIIALLGAGPLTDNCNVNVANFMDRTLAMTETTMPIEFDRHSLRTLDLEPMKRFTGQSPKGQLSTAHPHFDRQRGLHYNLRIYLGARSRYRLLSIDDRSGRQRSVCHLPAGNPSYVHSFGMTKDHLVLCQTPFVVNPLKLRFSWRPFIENYAWKPELGTRIRVIHKDSGKCVVDTRAEPCFSFHHVNAWESEDAFIVDWITYPNADVIESLYLDRLRTGQRIVSSGRLTRLQIARDGSSTTSDQTLLEPTVELPRFNDYQHAGHEYRYAYFCSSQTPTDYATNSHGNPTPAGDLHANRNSTIRPDVADQPSGFLNSLIKFDAQQATHQSWFKPGMYPGEPVFVASPGASQEDAGVVLSLVLDTQQERSFLLALDAATWHELGRATLPHAVPFGFHGQFWEQSDSIST